ncbi:MAG: prephenate dehydratase [Paludibacteraceae bacterium]|nr:prephenate dehydratase [Paludibacteraceae bacterium]MEE3483643.1 prephenate dehydratase [Bacteroidales bacterium]
MKRVAIQGIAGCFHDIAAREYFKGEEIEIIACETFRDVFDTIKKDSSIIGAVAIENTIAGSLLQNHNLLKESGLKIAGEYKLRIKHNLVALPGQKISDIHEVHSHPIALMQCGDFLQRNKHIKAVESDDTASSAKRVAEEGKMGVAAICGEMAAKIYGLEILEKGIETNKHNFTRFLIVADSWLTDELSKGKSPNKASLVFSLPHEQGSLAMILSILSYYGLNLTKIQSLPIIGREWEYQFYVNLSFTQYVRYTQALSAITPLTKDLKVLGEYQEANQSL